MMYRKDMSSISASINSHKRTAVFLLIVAVLAFGFCVYEVLMLRVAHSTFDNYYAFRGCEQLLTRTDTSGTCKLASGDVIKIVKLNGGWYLDGDFPICWSDICL